MKSGNFGQLVLKLCLSWAICRFNAISQLLILFQVPFLLFFVSEGKESNNRHCWKLIVASLQY